jgi:hypothetical protein
MEVRTETFYASGSVGAYRVVAPATASVGQRRCQLWTTNTMHIIGVAQDNATDTYGLPVATHMGDIVSCVCDLSVSVGALVGPGTTTGGIVERALAATAAVWAVSRLGIALESGSTNSVINVLLHVDNIRTT